MNPASVLVADDEKIVRTFVRGLLEEAGYAVREACDGGQALAEVEQSPPDLVLLDVGMPGMDGYKVCDRLKADARTRLLPVVMISGLGQSSYRLRAAELGADDYLVKPLSPDEFLARVRSLVSLKKFTDQLESPEEVLKTLVQTLEARDAYTAAHSRRMARWAVRIGQTLGWDDDALRTLELGALFHDIGKVAIRDAILGKPGRLSPEEFEIMKRHPVHGFDLCRNIKGLKRALSLIRHHHEKLDGSGYPDGLAGDEISVSVRIISVVDVYDALSSERPYKPAFTAEQSLQILRGGADRNWWDAGIVEILAQLVFVSGPGA